MTTETILADLNNITYSATAHTKERRFRVHDEEFEEFDKFPLIVIESGSEEDRPLVNRGSEVRFRPSVHFFAENETAANMETWRDAIRNAIMNDTTLRADAILVTVTGIAAGESEVRKLQHLTFSLEIVFDISHT